MANAPFELRAGLIVVHHCANVVYHEKGVGGGFIDRHHDSAEDYLSEERVEAKFIPEEATESLRRVHMRKVVVEGLWVVVVEAIVVERGRHGPSV